MFIKTVILTASLLGGSLLGQNAKVEPFDGMDVIRVAPADAERLRQLKEASDKAKVAYEDLRKQVSQQLEETWNDTQQQKRQGVDIDTPVSNSFVFSDDFRFARHQRITSGLTGSGSIAWPGMSVNGDIGNCQVMEPSTNPKELSAAEAQNGLALHLSKMEADNKYAAWLSAIAKKYGIAEPLTFSRDFGMAMTADRKKSTLCPQPN